MSTTMRPTGSAISRPAPIAAAIGSSIRWTRRAPAASDASSTARFSTSVTPDGAHTIRRGWARLPIEHLADEIAQHLLGDVEVGDHAVAQWARRRDRRRRSADHPLGVRSHRVNATGQRVRGDDRRLRHHDAPAPDVHERVGRAEVDRHVPDPKRGSQMTARNVAARAVSAKAHQYRVSERRPGSRA